MAISNVTITQDNFFDGSNLLPVQSPLVFLVDVTYSGAVPEILLADIIEDGEVLETYRAIPNNDPLATVREFAFVADAVIRGLMGRFDDTPQLNETLVAVPNITKELTLKFYDPDEETTFDEVEAVFVHGCGQFGERPNFYQIFNNETDTYLAPDGFFAYVYFYNDDEGNVLTIGDASLQLEFAQDFNDEIFTDFDDTPFEIDVPI